MIKLLYIPTGNAFTIPDEEALEMLKTNRGDFKVLEGGLQEEKEEKLEPETVKELVMQKEPEQEVPKEEEFDYSTLKRHELVAAAKRLNIVVTNTDTKATLLEKIYEKIGR